MISISMLFIEKNKNSVIKQSIFRIRVRDQKKPLKKLVHKVSFSTISMEVLVEGKVEVRISDCEGRRTEKNITQVSFFAFSPGVVLLFAIKIIPSVKV